MASFQGGKQRIGKYIACLIDRISRLKGMQDAPYVEPFCGWCGVLRHIPSISREGRIIQASDRNASVVEMWKELQNGWTPPPTITKEKYLELKHSDEDSAVRGFMGVVCGFNGIFFGSFKYNSPYRKDPIEHGLEHARKIATDCARVDFLDGRNYKEWSPDGCVVYCDPPYADTVEKRNKFFEFNIKEFWDTMDKWSANNLVIVSERTAPPHWKCIWENKRNHAYSGGRVKELIERVFIHSDVTDGLDV